MVPVHCCLATLRCLASCTLFELAAAGIFAWKFSSMQTMEYLREGNYWSSMPAIVASEMGVSVYALELEAVRSRLPARVATLREQAATFSYLMVRA
ncbi:hypothetical protein EON66_02425 [archaeon]|nr:MAG: hypothetical protein EON66_02425 [archaeon]